MNIADAPSAMSPYVLMLLIVACISPLILYIGLLPPHKRGFLHGKRYVMPPGPKGLPVLGSLLDWLKARNGGSMVPWLIEQSHHGDYTTLSMGTKTWVLLNTSRAAHEVIGRHAGVVHERPFFPVAGGLVSRGRRFFLLRTAQWREGRRIMHRLLMRPESSGVHARLTEDASLGLLAAYLDDPAQWYLHNYRFPLTVINRIVTGGGGGNGVERSSSPSSSVPMASRTSAELMDLQRVTSTFLTAINSSFAEFFPWLNALPVPLQFWRRHYEEMGLFHYSVFRHWWAGLKGSAAVRLPDPHTGPPPPCPPAFASPGISTTSSSLPLGFGLAANTSGNDSEKRGGEDDGITTTPGNFISDIMLNPAEFSGAEDNAMYLTLFILSAGADNPRMTLNAFVMACLSHSEAMRAAQRQLDAVCGSSGGGGGESDDDDDDGHPLLRLPSLSDLASLPYIVAMAKETLRWRPTVPLIPQRVAVRDFECADGWVFPAGTEFLVNSVPVCRDGYADADAFVPERWIPGSEFRARHYGVEKEEGGYRQPGGGLEMDLWEFGFSAGKRSCVGYKLAQKELFVALARVLYCFDIVPGGEFNDKELNAFSPGEPFPARMRVRSGAHARLIRDEEKRARAEGVVNW